jgi:3-oxochol-4-en-24-oyl-CoA dehydrogenase
MATDVNLALYVWKRCCGGCEGPDRRASGLFADHGGGGRRRSQRGPNLMGIAIREEHVELAGVVRSFLQRHDARKAARAALEGDTGLPDLWSELAAMGWLGLHVPEALGGSGFGLLETAIVAEELGRFCTPGPFLPSAVVTAALVAAGAVPGGALGRLVSGDAIVGLGVGGSLRLDDARRLHGDAGGVLGAPHADLLALVVNDDLVVVDRGRPGITLAGRTSLDPTRPADAVRCDGVEVLEEELLPGAAVETRRVLEVLVSAEAAGAAAACCEMAASYAKERSAFGRPIGQFQAVKHHCANMLVASEAAAAVAWEAALATTDAEVVAKAAASVALASLLQCAKLNIQVHGGIGYTWEHDAHVYLRRAGALVAVAGPLGAVRHAVGQGSLGVGKSVGIDVSRAEHAEAYAAAARRFAEELLQLPEEERPAHLVDRGYLYPHWPEPWGRGANPVEQLIIAEELAAVPLHDHLGPNAWILPIVLPTIMVHGTEAQQSRWIRPTMVGKVRWCQLFSEPGAGSDLASLSTRAERAKGGWRITGQKVWTSDAHQAHRGLALVRTNPEAPQHRGITCMIVDMASPGVTVRPLRQLTGDAEFNEVFLDDVFVPDDDVVGEVDAGWSVARTSLEVERVSVGGGIWSEGPHLEELGERAARSETDEPGVVAELGELRALGLAVRALNVRAVHRALAGAHVGIEGTMTKLLSAEVGRRMADLGQRLLGSEGLLADQTSENLSAPFLYSRMMSIAGGTSEILRNVLAEQVLGLPRDPKPSPTP